MKELLKMLGIKTKEEPPEKAVEELDFAKAMLESILIPYGFTIPDKDAKKFVVFNNHAYYYPPEEYYEKELNNAAFIDMVRNHRVVPLTIGNVRVLQSWENAKKEWGYALVFQFLYDTFNIIMTPEDSHGKDEDSKEV